MPLNEKICMNKQKYYRYNENTLQFEEIKTSLFRKILKYSSGIVALSIYALGVWVLVTPDYVKTYLSEKNIIQNKIDNSSYTLDKIAESLESIKDRDNILYRSSFALGKIGNGTWEGGVGGSVKNPEIAQLSDSKKLLELARKVQNIQHKMSVLATSQDELLSKAAKEEKRLRSIPAIRPIPFLDRPLHLLSGFGMRRDPVTKASYQMHPGIDMGALTGTPIVATGDGVVVRVEYKTSGYGLNVVIDHGYGYKTLYGHMVEIATKPGKKVKRGEIIGYVGSTGYSTAPHVHYEVFKNNERINPAPFIANMTLNEFKELIKTVDPNADIRPKRQRGKKRR